MQLSFHQQFKKQYRKLSPILQKKAKATTKIFKRSPHDPHLRNHALKGNLLGRRAISVTGNVRIIFSEENDYQRVTFLGIGTHNQVYK